MTGRGRWTLRIADLAAVSRAVAATSGRLHKIKLIAELLRSVSPEEAEIAVAYLSGYLPQGTIGVGWAALRDLPPPSSEPSLTVDEVDAALTRIQETTGPGSQTSRQLLLEALFARATEPERRFLRGLLVGELRQGALEGIVIEAVASAAGAEPSAVRRARMLAGELGPVTRAALSGGPAALSQFSLRPLHPVQPMLAKTAEGLREALARLHPAVVEWKLDGVRIQVHRLGRDVRVFTRNLADVTERVPEIVNGALAMKVQSVILDGEAIALYQDGRPRPFQESMSRFGSRLEIDRHSRRVPLSARYFDCLHLNGQDLIDRRAADRFDALSRVVPRPLQVPRRACETVTEAQRVLEVALECGHEGVMVKSLDGAYDAGRRGAGWLKVKRPKTLDLVVLAAEWGHGRRRGWLSNLHLGARDPQGGGFAMLGKTFKGMTDEMLAWQTKRLLELEIARDEFTVYVRPALVVEVAFDDVQASTRYPSGMALRFARIKGYRHDKRPEDADTIDTVRAIHTGAAAS